MRLGRAAVTCVATFAILPASAQGVPKGSGPEGTGHREPRIVGGEVAPGGAYPFAVALLTEAGLHCGGSIIGATTVLTAAHCIDGLLPERVEVLAGTQRLDDPAAVRVGVLRYAAHRGADVAILFLESALTQPAVDLAMPEQAALYAPGMPARVIGWGTTRESGNGTSNNLRQVEVPIVEDDRCVDAYRGESVVDPSREICAGAAGRDSCPGDSGGPLLVIDEANRFRQVGVVSYGKGCARRRYPGVYAEVPALLSFITDPDPVLAPVPELERARIAGRSRVGGRMRCAHGPWVGEDITFRYQWHVGFGDDPTSRKRILTPGPRKAGSRTTCTVTGRNAGGSASIASEVVRIRGERR